ncbi:hypothetical protein AD931_11275 [Gluconobacter oxydans]|uniref:Uncharacterized protein n=4 Tax=Gluconobacter oxydans TaxID=442 RepID=A0A149UE08_GLUOY|nr:hypothetical protein GLS_c18870 [Gluconobacter oxydans DSM 3504]KXV07211.1 hypothetical protein AD931_11275 [Gluconobacter oxydans]GEM17342.1 hypothetical protein NBRC3293_1839 [Gluconobacter oxydans NBRC 3293]KXV17349.1 hypothetical protein AD934_12170 [Gluconobacter oxydans]KXV30174.1 hypothetical protein AD939_12685 [Gluconobacter oxydans]
MSEPDVAFPPEGSLVVMIGQGPDHMLSSSRFFCHALLATALLGGAAQAQTASFGQPYAAGTTLPTQPGQSDAQSQTTTGGEHFRARGHRKPPPGYSDTPSTDFEHGPDPDHEAGVERDSVTGANLSKFGSSYQGSNNTQSGQLGDASGNGWTAPRGNGW